MMMVRTRRHKIESEVGSLLQEVNSSNVESTIDRLGGIQLCLVQELELMGQLIFEQVCAAQIPCEILGDIEFALCERYANFEGAPGEKPSGLRTILLRSCQTEFDNCLAVYDQKRNKKKSRARIESCNLKMSALAAFLGRLFKHGLLPLLVVHDIAREMVGRDRKTSKNSTKPPCGDVVSIFCEWLEMIGQKLYTPSDGQLEPHRVRIVDEFSKRLRELLGSTMLGQTSYSVEVQSRIQDVLSLHERDWVPLVVQLEEAMVEDGCCPSTGKPVVRARYMSGEECGCVSGSLADTSITLLRRQVSERSHVRDCNLRMLLPSGVALNAQDFQADRVRYSAPC